MWCLASSALAVTSSPHDRHRHLKKEAKTLSPMATDLHQKTPTFRKASMLSAMETKVYNCACCATPRSCV